MESKASPQRIFEMLNGYQVAGALKAAIELEVFTHIGSGRQTAKELAAEVKVTERGMRILCDALVSFQLLEKQGLSYSLTLESAVFLDEKSSAYLGGVSEFLVTNELVDCFKDVAGAVRRGGTLIPSGGTVSEANPVWVKFARAMAPMMAMPSTILAKTSKLEHSKPLKILDIAAGHGMFGIQMAKEYPLAEIYALDWPAVLEVAYQNARRFGVDSRYHGVPGDAFAVDWGREFDAVLFPNFLHHFDRETCESLMRKAHAALKPSGKVFTVEFVPNEERSEGPLPFALTMLCTTNAGDAYTESELSKMFREAGFRETEVLDRGPQTVLMTSK